MERTTIMLPSELKNKVMKQAAKKQISLAQFIREALELSLKTLEQEGEQVDPFVSDTNIYYGKSPKDLSNNHDAYLYGDKK